jgi:hypothetical protein
VGGGLFSFYLGSIVVCFGFFFGFGGLGFVVSVGFLRVSFGCSCVYFMCT